MSVAFDMKSHISAHHHVALVTVKPPSRPPLPLSSSSPSPSLSVPVYRSYLPHVFIMGSQMQYQLHVFAAERMLPIVMVIACCLVSYDQLDFFRHCSIQK